MSAPAQGLMGGYFGIMEKKVETIGIFRVYTGIIGYIGV